MEIDPRSRQDLDMESQRDERDDINWNAREERQSYDKPDHFERSSYLNLIMKSTVMMYTLVIQIKLQKNRL